MKWIVLLALLGCVHRRSDMPPGEQRSVVLAVLAAWEAVGLPAPRGGRNGCDMHKARVILASESEYMARCRNPSTASAGCLNMESSGHFFRPIDYPVVVVSPAWRVEPGIVAHELLHAMYLCSGLPDPYGLANAGHGHPMVWKAAGGAGSAQAIAESFLGETL